MKKLISLLLVLTLILAPAVPALAAETDARLAAVTSSVKRTLELDTEGFTEFYGNLEDNPLAPVWYLDWYGEDGTLSVSATESGKILNYYRSVNTVVSNSFGQFAPHFPAGSVESAKAAAEAFLDKVLTEGETVVWDEDTNPGRLGVTRYRFHGEILVNGLSAGLMVSVAVNCEDNAIISFSRDDLSGKVMGTIPSATARVSAQKAAGALRTTLAMRLEYVLAEGSDTEAILRYLPEGGDEYYVDARTGELVNLSELYRNAAQGEFGDFGMVGGTTNDTAASAPAEKTESALSPAEREGVEKLEGVLKKDALDAKVRAYSALGLDSYTLATVNYTVGREADETGVTPVTATLRYGRQVGEHSWRRTATVDARTGELLSLYSSAYLPEGTQRTVEFATAQATAENFLMTMKPEQFGKTALHNSVNAMDQEYTVSHSFTYAQWENGYLYEGNTLRVGVDATDGSISAYTVNFNDAVTFESPEGIISGETAIDAWLNTYETKLQYVLVPAAIDFSQPEYKPLAGLGVSYLYKLVPGYQLEREDYLYGIDAKTGKAAMPAWVSQSSDVAYTDLEGHWAKEQIEKLAQYDVGYVGGTFQPDKPLTQVDLIALLVSTQGYLYRAEEEGSTDYLYQRAYALGMLKEGERSEDSLLTRAQMVKVLLDAAGYTDVAQLKGIFRTNFADDGEIPADYYGYAALAQGLGIVGNTPGSRFQPNMAATRAEAAVILYNLMSR